MRETKDLEFKGSISNTFLKTVSAFANFNGGKILFGIADDGTVTTISKVDTLFLRFSFLFRQKKRRSFRSLRRSARSRGTDDPYAQSSPCLPLCISTVTLRESHLSNTASPRIYYKMRFRFCQVLL